MTETSKETAKKKIMVVDDEPYIQGSLRLFLEMEGFEVITASDGLEALKKLTQVSPDLIILDLMMPNMDGYDFARELRKKKEYDGTYVLAVTALGQERDKIRSTEVGINEHFTKPYQPDKLIQRIKAILDSVCR